MTSFHPMLKGVIELHCHSSPSIFPRRQNDWELVADVLAAGMAGVVIKSHEAQTADRATIIRERYPELHVYGGLACNYFTGGLSPTAVDAAIRAGAKVIWMPTFSAHAHQEHFAKKKTAFFASEKPLTHPGQGLEIWDEKRRVRPEVHEILSLVAEADIVLATGHLSPAEVLLLVDTARERGVKKILAQHTDLGIARIPFELELQLARKGAILEKCYLACSNDFNDITPEQMADSIRRIGAQSCVLVTDYGQKHNIPTVSALSDFVGVMLDFGIGEKEVERMIVSNPRQLLGI
jgi:hypothetical protein